MQFAAAGGQKHPKPLALHIAREELPNLRVVVDDEYAWRRSHGSVF
jgi:hypothetical protein